ncbi:MAG: TonB-dependent receptor [Mangrovibacterium sp.]
MKTFLFIMVLSIGQLLAIDSYSQKTTISLDFRQSRLVQVLDEIENQSDFYFLFNEKLIDVNRKVDIQVEDQEITNILTRLFAGTNIEFQIIDRKIVLSPNNENFSFLLQQPKSMLVKGNVRDSSGNPLLGVTIVVKGTTQGTITGTDGDYSLANVPGDATLVFSFVGMRTLEIPVDRKTSVNIVLQEETVGLEEVVAVGYGVQKKENLTGAVASVNSEKLTLAPVASTSNTLAGRLPGLITLQSSGRPGYDQASLSIRGFGAALVIVDGVELGFNDIDPNQIESVSILKDGAAAIYGARAGNGVILITTKRGNDQKPTIRLNSSYTLQGVTAYSKAVNAGQYAELTNERYTNQGLPAPYSAEQVQKYYDGTDPQYPNTDWYKEAIRNWAPQQQHNLSVQGGSDKVRYYGFFGYAEQEYFWKKNGGNFEKYNLQSKIDAKITDNLTVQLDILSILGSRLSSSIPQGAGSSSVWQMLWNTLPIYPATLPDPTKLSFANPIGIGSVVCATDMNIVGYSKAVDHDLKGAFMANYTFPYIKGLSAKAFVNYSQRYAYFKQFVKPFDFYTYDYSTDTYTLVGAYGTAASLSENRNQIRNMTGQLSINYENTFKNVHSVKVMALYEVIDYWNDYLGAGRDNFLTPAIEYMFGGASDKSKTSGSGTEMGRASYVGRLNYSYKDKYLLESTIRADASAQFPTEHRWGYFPSISLGWRLTQESFMQHVKAFDNLKLRVSYGSSGQDNVSNFAYLSGYALSGQWLIGSETQKGLVSTGLANPLLTWEKIKIYNIGVDFSLWKRRLFGEADAFYRDLSGIPATRILSLPNTFGASLPPENINSQNTRGFELNLGTSGKYRDFSYEVTGNLSWSRSKWDHFEEPVYTDPDQIRLSKLSGRWTDVQFGYVSDGLFTSQDEITNLGYTYSGGNSALGPGDIKYADVNDDHVLDWKDQVEIGKGTFPHWMTGLNINLKFKNFDLSSLFQGAFGYYSYVTLDHGNLTYPVEVYNLRWTEANNTSTALIPRMGGASSNKAYSDYYYKNASYLRLKVLSAGYTVPKNFVSRLNLKELRFYFAGTNLLTLSKLFKDYNVDPEAPTNNAAFYYPQQKTISLGVNISF